MMPAVSVIVTTYNWPQALNSVLWALSEQDYPNLEVIVADDGSREDTAKLIQTWRTKFSVPLIHCWQPDEGFRAAMIRNRAAAIANHEYLIFIDGDCVVAPNFVSNHVRLAESGWFVAGNRILLNQSFTENVLSSQLPIHQWSRMAWFKQWYQKNCNRLLPFYSFPLGFLRKMAKTKWQGAKTCNLALWRDDFLRVNGFDEQFEGWGFEDSDCVIRLQKAHVYRKSAQCWAPVLHLWHPCANRDKEQENAKRLEHTLQSPHIQAYQGISQYPIHGND